VQEADEEPGTVIPIWVDPPVEKSDSVDHLASVQFPDIEVAFETAPTFHVPSTTGAPVTWLITAS
jgi:hypothetical protein